MLGSGYVLGGMFRGYVSRIMSYFTCKTSGGEGVCFGVPIWVAVKIMVPFWIPIIICAHLVFSTPSFEA